MQAVLRCVDASLQRWKATGASTVNVYGARFHTFQRHLKLFNQDFDSPIYLVYTPLVFLLPMFITNIINWI